MVHCATVFARTIESPVLARRWLAEQLASRLRAQDLQSLLLVLSELVTNAVVHGEGDVTVAAILREERARLEVSDGAPEWRIGGTTPRAEGGRGLRIVEALADRWSVDHTAAGKTVWAELTVVRIDQGRSARRGEVRSAVQYGPAQDPGSGQRADMESTSDSPGWSGRPDDVAARLEKLESVTDSNLTRLDVDDLLDELLARVTEILDVDTAAVLLVEPGSSALVARAARGIEEEVRQGVRVPIGTGFAGRIAALRTPVRLDRVDSTTVANPILWEKGIRTMLGVPLFSEDEVLGVLHVGRLDDRPFDEEDSHLLQVVGDRIAGAIQTRELAIERAAAIRLERSLLPSRLPTVPGLSFAARYVPAEDRAVGGDWYDLFVLPSGQLWVVVGDVAGHGVQAAVVMGRIRSALRAYALVDTSPAHVLDLVDRKVEQFEIDAMATVACAVSSPPYDALTIASAGHPAPVMASPGSEPAFVGVETSPPIGAALFGRARRSTTITLPRDTTVAFFTDGLIERRGKSLDDGLERLRGATTIGPPERVAADIMRKLVGDTVLTDDVALVVISRECSGGG
jgi:anti-sigma regulatory factor (Ser/Thr protein kinase)